MCGDDDHNREVTDKIANCADTNTNEVKSMIHCIKNRGCAFRWCREVGTYLRICTSPHRTTRKVPKSALSPSYIGHNPHIVSLPLEPTSTDLSSMY